MIRVVNVNHEYGTVASVEQLPKSVQMLSLNPAFAQNCDPRWNLMSLGDYMSSLHPSMNNQENCSLQKIPDWLKTELQAVLSTALLMGLGRQLGTIVLPTLGLHFIQESIRKVVEFVSIRMSKIVNSIGDSNASRDAEQHLVKDEDNPFGGIPLSLSALSSVAELNYQHHKQIKPLQESTSNVSSLDLLLRGEVGYGLSFHDNLPIDVGDACTESPSVMMVPNPFILSKHWTCAIELMERRIQQCEATYEPDSRAMPLPKPIDERWFPDLFLGWGDALCTHTKREILHNRLMATLLNKLASNYELELKIGKRTPFVVQMDISSPEILKPSVFIESLIDSGYSVETCVQTQTTTFGVALCVRERDGSWTNIPLAYFLQDGFSDAKGNESFVCLPHSGLNLEIIGTNESLIQKISIQHYMAIEGLCGWHSNHSANVSWLNRIVFEGSTRIGKDALGSVCIAGLQAIVVNAVSTSFDLPHGGYGLIGVCNDSAALLEMAISPDRKTHIFPLTFIGKFAMQLLRMAYEFRIVLNAHDNRASNLNKMDLESLDHLIEAILHMPSDVNMAPVNVIEQCRRWLCCQTQMPPFLLMKKSRFIVEGIESDMIQMRSSANLS